MNNLDQELDKLLFKLRTTHEVEHNDNQWATEFVYSLAEAKQAIQSLITTQKQEAYIQGYNDNARDCYCDSKKAIESLIPHHHLMDDGESHDIRPNIKSIITTKREEI